MDLKKGTQPAQCLLAAAVGGSSTITVDEQAVGTSGEETASLKVGDLTNQNDDFMQETDVNKCSINKRPVRAKNRLTNKLTRSISVGEATCMDGEETASLKLATEKEDIMQGNDVRDSSINKRPACVRNRVKNRLKNSEAPHKMEGNMFASV
jgi:hypothetical protein